MGTTVERMNELHDMIHDSLCRDWDVDSYSLRVRDGEKMTPAEIEASWYEEDAVLHVQRWLHKLKQLGLKGGY